MNTVVLLSCLTLLHGALLAPHASFTPVVAGPQQPEPREHYRAVFDAVRQGLESGNIASLSRHMAPQVQLSLRGGESGLFSADQAYYLLENYFRVRRLVSLKFTTIGESDVNPYATGGAGISFKGSREYVQVYVALSLADDRWAISRINIY